jgi:hypothetical protein
MYHGLVGVEVSSRSNGRAKEKQEWPDDAVGAGFHFFARVF